MTHKLWILGLAIHAATSALANDAVSDQHARWPQWRGPRADGLAMQADPPLRWDEATNIAWKVEIGGEGSSTPIVWDDQVFVLSAVKTDRVAENPPQTDERAKTVPPDHIYQFIVTSFDRQTGAVRWRRVAIEDVPHEGRHGTNSYASASPTTDGERLYVSFGSRGVFCFDLDGNPLWQRDLGDMRTRYGWGEATSPVVHGDSLVINWDHEDQSFLTVLDARTGETKWRVDRDEPTSWATPLVVERAGRAQLIVNGTNRARGYDLANGEVIWECGGQTVNAIPSPLVFDDNAICMSGYTGAAAYSIPLDSRGDITDTDRIVWHHGQATPYVPSPIIVDGVLYFTRSNTAVLSALDAATGKPVFSSQRLPELTNLYASPIATRDRIYFVDRNGTTLVIRPGTEIEVLAVNKLDDGIDASPVPVGNQLFLRGSRYLYCIEEK